MVYRDIKEQKSQKSKRPVIPEQCSAAPGSLWATDSLFRGLGCLAGCLLRLALVGSLGLPFLPFSSGSSGISLVGLDLFLVVERLQEIQRVREVLLGLPCVLARGVALPLDEIHVLLRNGVNGGVDDILNLVLVGRGAVPIGVFLFGTTAPALGGFCSFGCLNYVVRMYFL